MHAHKEPNYINGAVIEKDSIKKYYDSIDGKTTFLIIAEEGDKLVGFLKVVIKEIEPFFLLSKVLYLDQIYVLEKFRNQGVAKLLLKEAEEIARRENIVLLKARVYQFNAPAQQAIKSAKFTQLYSEYFKMIK